MFFKKRKKKIYLYSCIFSLLLNEIMVSSLFFYISYQNYLVNFDLFFNIFINASHITAKINQIPDGHLIYQKIVHIFYNESETFSYIHFSKQLKDKNNSLDANNWLSHSTMIYCVRNALVNGCGCTIFNESVFRYPSFYWQVEYHDGFVERSVKEAISIGNIFMKMFAHMLMDVIAPFTLLPDDVKRNVPIIVPYFSILMPEYLEMMGYNKSNVIIMKSSMNYIFCETVYLVQGKHLSNSGYGAPLLNVSKLIVKNLNLSKEKPNRFVFENRYEGSLRYISNFDEIFEKVRAKYPMYPWEKGDSQNMTVKEQAKHFNSILLLVCPTGSNVANAIFMQEQTAILMIFANWFDRFAIFSCLTNHIHAVVCCDPFIDHWAPQEWVLKYQTIGMSLRTAIHIVRPLFISCDSK